MRAIFQNEEDRSIFLSARIVDEASSVLIYGSGTEPDRFQPAAAPDDPPIVLLPGRILRQKGVREFADASRILKLRGSNVRFAIVGDTAGNRDAVPPRELDAMREQGVVEFWGWSDNMASAMRRATIICLPSYHEGLPKALVDACAAGRPIVATDIAGCRAVVQHGINGLLVPPKDGLALANAVQILLSDRSLRERMGASGRTIAKTKFDIELIVRATLEVYDDISK
jgi:glycosyltransferase involved in cell wall biosynthesis